ncbi:MAG: amidohydrolase [Bacteroidales bacterium]|nr:amidohydrolase [Bacteroidales bacterium]
MNLKVTIIQSDLVWENIEANLHNFENKINSITEETNLIVLSEMFATGFSMNPEKFAPFQDKVISAMKKFSEKKNAVVTGTVITEKAGNYYNTLIWMKPDGTYETYDKRHLFSFAGEDKFYSQGKEHLLASLKGLKIMPLICYDLRFPVWSRNKFNYDLLIYVANWPQRRNDAWKTLLKARAIENLSFVIGVNRIGNDGNGVYHSGDSAVYDPKGNKISKTKPDEENIETLNLDLSELNKFREKFPAGKDADNFIIRP